MTIFRNLLILLPFVFFYSCIRNPVGNSTYPDTTDQQKYIAVYDSLRQSFRKGEKVFSQYCTNCHCGPEDSEASLFFGAVKNLPEPREENFVLFISDSKSLKESGVPWVLKLDRDFNVEYEHSFGKAISIQQMHDLMIYFKMVINDQYRFMKENN